MMKRTSIFAATLLAAQLSHAAVLETFTGATINDANADDTTVGQFTSTSADMPTLNVNSDFNGNPSFAVSNNVEGFGIDGLTYAFDSTGLTGEQTVSFDIAVIDDGVQGAGDALASPTASFTLWGEVHPWNTANSFNYTSQDNGGYYADQSQQSMIAIDTVSATTTIGGSYLHVEHVFDLGETGFDHHADGGTAGANVLYFNLSWENMSSGDAIYMDNLSIAPVPEPATYGLLAAAAALGVAFWRRRR